MDKPQVDAGATREHRPLPSVDLALLPHEVRASRMRQLTVLVLAALTLIGGVAAAFGQDWLAMIDQQVPQTSDDPWPSEGGPTGAEVLAPASATPPVDAPAAAVAPAEPESQAMVQAATAVVAPDALEMEVAAALGGDPVAPARVTRPFGQARGFRDALRGAGASPEEADALVASLEKLVDFRRCRPEHELTFERDGTGELASFEYRASATEQYRAIPRPGGGFAGSKIEIEVERRRLARGSRVAGSLGGALDALGLGRSMASAFVSAFEGLIDFKKHTRKGDSFKLLVDEEHVEGAFLRYGPVLALEYQGARAGLQRAFWFEPKPGQGDYYDDSGRAIHGGWLRTPLAYDHVSSGFNPRRKHPILKRIVPHNGIDYAASPGTTVWAAADGTVTFAGVRGANGNLVALRHASGYETYYAHLLRISRGITAGATVTQRQPIGAVGSTGRSTGPHLHFALKRHGAFINPDKQLNGPGKPLPTALMPRFKRELQALKKELAAIAVASAPTQVEPPPEEPAADEVFHDEEALDL